jgi:SpoVK/Ycf46/Vps4 family AAA+-type ATPase
VASLPPKPSDATPLENALLDIARLALLGDIRSLRQRSRNLLRDGDSAPLGASAREYLALLLTSLEPIAPALREAQSTADPDPFEGASFVQYEDAGHDEEPVLSDTARAALRRFIDERRRADVLLAAGVNPSSALLLSGPPGVGKTMTARYLATALNVPLLRAQPAAVMSSLLGQSARNLRSLLAYGASLPCVLLLDEFDAYARRRGDTQDIAETKRLVNTLLLELEEWPQTSVLVAATNHAESLDPALERRFDLCLELDLPDERARAEILTHALRSMGAHADLDITRALAFATDGMSGSDLAAGARVAVRRSLLDHGRIEITLAQALAQGRLDGRSAPARRARETFALWATNTLGMSQRDIAQICGVSHVTIGEFLRSADSRRKTEPAQVTA